MLAAMRTRALLLVVVGLVACGKASTSEAPAPAPAASEAALRQKAREELEERKHADEQRKKEEEQATMRILADEAEAAAKAREADLARFRGKSAAQLKAAARRECRGGKCDPDVLSEIVEAARPEDTDDVRCVARFEEDSWSCRQGINEALCNPPPCP
jgi:hypothetical protein